MKRLMWLITIFPLLAQGTEVDIEAHNDMVLHHYQTQQQPVPIRPFELYYEDIPTDIKKLNGQIKVEFDINENGDVENPNVIDTFNIELNSVVIDKIKQAKYVPARQNGRPVRVRFQLPIQFK